MPKAIRDLTNQRFGRLTALSFVKRENHRTLWKCQCECGKQIITDSSHLVSGHTKSCGCYAREISVQNGKKTIHGKSYTRLHRIWRGMKKRCTNRNCEQFSHYGGRGIAICEEWKNDFSNFYNWAMDNGYQENLTIDRIDVNGNYEPNNCRWATIAEQNKNKRKKQVYAYTSK